VNHAILGNLQDVFNLLPNLGTAPPSAAKGAAADNVGGANSAELARAMSIKTNDQLMAIYLSSLIRAITAFHDLIENKIQNRQQQEERDAVSGVEKEGKDKDKQAADEKTETPDKTKADASDKEKTETGKESNGVNGTNSSKNGGAAGKRKDK
jgi:26S proteasome regulatory subunit N8